MCFAVFPFTGIQDLHIGNSAVFDGDHVVHVRQGPNKYGKSQLRFGSLLGAYNHKSLVCVTLHGCLSWV